VIKLVYTLCRRADLTPEEFQRYWREQHAPLVVRHAETLRIRRYLQVHAVDSELDEAVARPRGSEPRHFDGVAELWWDSLEDLLAPFSTPAGQLAGRELLEDERRFIDLERSPLRFGVEHPVIG
jgi:uncharacterized protein (TIGR02118 family)